MSCFRTLPACSQLIGTFSTSPSMSTIGFDPRAAKVPVLGASTRFLSRSFSLNPNLVTSKMNLIGQPGRRIPRGMFGVYLRKPLGLGPTAAKGVNFGISGLDA